MLDDVEGGDDVLGSVGQRGEMLEEVGFLDGDLVAARLLHHEAVGIDAAGLIAFLAEQLEPLAAAAADIEHGPLPAGTFEDGQILAQVGFDLGAAAAELVFEAEIQRVEHAFFFALEGGGFLGGGAAFPRLLEKHREPPRLREQLLTEELLARFEGGQAFAHHLSAGAGELLELPVQLLEVHILALLQIFAQAQEISAHAHVGFDVVFAQGFRFAGELGEPVLFDAAQALLLGEGEGFEIGLHICHVPQEAGGGLVHGFQLPRLLVQAVADGLHLPLLLVETALETVGIAAEVVGDVLQRIDLRVFQACEGVEGELHRRRVPEHQAAREGHEQGADGGAQGRRARGKLADFTAVLPEHLDAGAQSGKIQRFMRHGLLR